MESDVQEKFFSLAEMIQVDLLKQFVTLFRNGELNTLACYDHTTAQCLSWDLAKFNNENEQERLKQCNELGEDYFRNCFAYTILSPAVTVVESSKDPESGVVTCSIYTNFFLPRDATYYAVHNVVSIRNIGTKDIKIIPVKLGDTNIPHKYAKELFEGWNNAVKNHKQNSTSGQVEELMNQIILALKDVLPKKNNENDYQI